MRHIHYILFAFLITLFSCNHQSNDSRIESLYKFSNDEIDVELVVSKIDFLRVDEFYMKSFELDSVMFKTLKEYCDTTFTIYPGHRDTISFRTDQNTYRIKRGVTNLLNDVPPILDSTYHDTLFKALKTQSKLSFRKCQDPFELKMAVLTPSKYDPDLSSYLFCD